MNRKNQPRRYILIAILVSVTWLLGNVLTVTAQEPTVSITSPASDETLSGLVTVTGSVDFTDFLKYEIMLKSGENLAWVATVYTPITEGNIARLDTRLFLDGTYQMIIRLVNSDTNYTDHFGPTITIDNGSGGGPMLPHPVIDSNFLYSPPNHALLRVRNCSQFNVEFDHNSPTGFCSAGDLWMMGKAPNSDYCPSVDLLLIPGCEYRGTIIEEGAPRGLTYSLEVEKGGIYQIDYPGGDTAYIGEVAGDEQVSLAAPASTKNTPETTTEPTESSAKSSNETKSDSEGELLPETGQWQATNWLFVGVALGIIVLLIVGGIVAIATRKQPHST